MKLRELIVSVLWKVNENSVSHADNVISRMKDRLAGIENKGGEALSGFGTSLSRIGRETESVNSQLSFMEGKLGRLMAFAGLTFSFHSFIAISDQWKTIEGQIKNVTNGEKELIAVEDELFHIADRTRQRFDASASLFTTVSRSASELGKDSEDILKFTEDVANAMLLGGGSAESQQAALIQLGQGLGSGTLRGDELNSIMEQAPILARTIAEGMGTSIGHLRKLGADGKITSEAVYNAVRSQSDKLKSEIGNMPWTVQQANVKISNSIGRLFFSIEKRMGIGDKISKGLAKVSALINVINDNIELVVFSLRAAAVAFSVFTVATKWHMLINFTGAFVRGLKMIYEAYMFATGAAVTFSSSQAASLGAIFKFGPIIAAITLVIFLIQDLYVWITGGESIVGEFFGSWEDNINELSRRWEQWKEQASLAVDQVWKGISKVIDFVVDVNLKFNPIVYLFKLWLEGIKTISSYALTLFNLFDEFQSKFTGAKIGDKINQIYFQGPEADLDANKVMSDSEAIRNNSKVITNSGNQTNYITVQTKPGESAEHVGETIADKLGFGGGFDEPQVEG